MRIHITILTLFLLNCSTIFAQDNGGYIIEGHLDNLKDSKIYLGNKGQGYGSGFKLQFYDSTYSKDGYFTFKGKVDESHFYSIETEEGKGWCTFLLENSKINITGSADSIWRSKINGSYEDSIYRVLNKSKNPLVASLNSSADSSNKYRKLGDTLTSKHFSELNQLFAKQIALKEYAFGITHLNSVINLFNILNIQRHLGNDTAKYLFNSLSIQVRSHSKAPEVRYKLFDLDSNIQIQNSAPHFSQSDNNSKIFSLSDYKGKYILLDFWASWCGPCRAENPNMLKAYKKYKKWGFEIIGISLDVDKRKWIQAIKEDNLPWKQVSDLKGGENKVALLYGIESIPMNFLIDPNGIIIAKNLRGEDLEAFLRTVIKQKSQ